MSTAEDDTGAQLDKLEQAATECIVAANDVLRAVFALRRLRETSQPLTHDGSAIPPDVELPLACTDDPPSREAL